MAIETFFARTTLYIQTPYFRCSVEFVLFAGDISFNSQSTVTVRYALMEFLPLMLASPLLEPSSSCSHSPLITLPRPALTVERFVPRSVGLVKRPREPPPLPPNVTMEMGACCFEDSVLSLPVQTCNIRRNIGREPAMRPMPHSAIERTMTKPM